MFLICIINCIGESGPGCSAHAQGCDGSTGTQKSSEWIWYFLLFNV